MNFTEYQAEAIKTIVYDQRFKLIYPSLGLVAEAGEVSGKVSKVLRDKNGIVTKEDEIDLKKELGDVLWFIAVLCNDLGITLEEVAQVNLDKLRSRMERGKIQGSGDNR